jgi:uncharacterized integral membrane protein
MADDVRRWNAGTNDDAHDGSGVSGKQIGVGLVVVALVVFVLQNTQTTTITMLLFDVSFPLWLVLAGTILLSVGVGYFIGSRGRSRRG